MTERYLPEQMGERPRFPDIQPTLWVILYFLVFQLFPSTGQCTVIASDTTWSGDITVEQDVLIPAGITLTIAPGTTIHVVPSESTKTDPEYLSPLTEIAVRGVLRAEGTPGKPVTFLLQGREQAHWAGIIIDGGKADLRSCIVRDAETAIEVNKGTLALQDCRITGNRYGLVMHGQDVTVKVKTTLVEMNEYGVVQLNGAKFEEQRTTVKNNRKKDSYRAQAAVNLPVRKEYAVEHKDAERVYGDQVILGMAIWQKRVLVKGVIRVPENSRLIILPGTVVEFTKRDTNSDGIGENGIMVQGAIIAKGTSDRPIIFRSAEKRKGMGDWDSINIMNSDRSQNLIEHCQIEDAYRGLHFHFSNVAVADSILRNNYRGIQFQESIVDIRRTHFYGNRSGLQARDSEVQFTDNVLYGNHTAMNVFRNSITISGNAFIGNEQEALRVREGVPHVERNDFEGNRYGLLVSDAVYGRYERNVISHNLESGVSLRGTNNIEISGNAIQANGLFGVNIQDAGALIKGNLVTDNGERGIGVLSFQGVITGNTILKNGLYNLGIDGPSDVSAAGNWWGGEDLKRTIYDHEDDPAKGRAVLLPVLDQPVGLSWPLLSIRSNTAWHGTVSVNSSISVQPGATLTVAPGTTVLFAKGKGMTVRGRIIARGTPNAMISFSGATGDGPEEWDEILMDHAPGSRFENCIFRNATWALHSHFTDLKVERCSFEKNQGGLRFTSGPLEIRRSVFRENGIGIRSFRGTAHIEENSITGNRIGIFVREKGGGLTIARNDLFSNSDYAVRLGDFNDEDVDARNNWWGGGEISASIYDALDEPGIGTVRYEPAAKKFFSWDVLPRPERGTGDGRGGGQR